MGGDTGAASRRGLRRSLHNGSSISVFQICLKRAGVTAATRYPYRPSCFSAPQTHHFYHTGKPEFRQCIQTPQEASRCGMGRRIPLRGGHFTLHGRPILGVPTERRETRLAGLFQAQYDVEVRATVWSTILSLILFYIDSRSGQKAVSNLLRQTSRKGLLPF